MNPTRFTFTSGGVQLVGLLYLPEARPVAAIVTTGPLTSVKEQATGAYAGAHPGHKAEDVSAAVTALAADDRTRDLPIVAVGVCAGGGYMARAVANSSAPGHGPSS